MTFFKKKDEFDEDVPLHERWTFKAMAGLFVAVVVTLISIAMAKYEDECERMVEDSYGYVGKTYNYVYSEKQQ